MKPVQIDSLLFDAFDQFAFDFADFAVCLIAQDDAVDVSCRAYSRCRVDRVAYQTELWLVVAQYGEYRGAEVKADLGFKVLACSVGVGLSELHHLFR